MQFGGCGTDALLLGSLTTPDEEFPLEVLTGIDIDRGIWNEGVKNAFPEEEEDRWMNIRVNLLYGKRRTIRGNIMR